MLRRELEGALPVGQARALETGIDVIGDVAIVKLDESARGSGEAVGQAILRSMKNVKAVFDQEGGIEGEFRLRRLRHLAGERRTLTTHRENGILLRVDVERCYFSPRLSTERLRVAELVGEGERILNMFAGVGPYSILIAKRRRTSEVWSCELNGTACELHAQNNRLNKVEGRVHVVEGDAMNLPELVGERFDRILMPHPSQSERYLAVARRMLRERGWIHYYRHVTGETVAEARGRLSAELSSILGGGFEAETRRVREIGPRYVELVADIRVP